MKQLPKFYNNLLYKLEILDSQIPNGGKGLFTKEYIKKGSFLGYYDGYWCYDKKKESSYSFYINDKIWLDIDMNNKPFSSIMNDSYRTDFTNNIEYQYTLSEIERLKITKKNCEQFNSCKMIKLFTTTEILPGTELFFSYGESYWKCW
jgi:hypothetical protein